MEYSPEQRNLTTVEITSERLKIVPLEPKYAADCFREYTTDVATYMSFDPPSDVAFVEERIRGSVEEMENGTNLEMVILDKDSGEFLGRTSLHHPDEKHPELGVWLKGDAHGKGYGREAVTALKEWADENVDYEYITYPVDKDNASSRKIAVALGGVEHREYQKETQSGRMLNTIEYRIYPKG